jgi:hypothetical protein
MLLQLKETIYFDGSPIVAGSIIETDDIPGLGGESLIHRGWAVEHVPLADAEDEPSPVASPTIPDSIPELIPDSVADVAPAPAPAEPSPAVEPAPAPAPVTEVVVPEPKPTKRKR